MDDEYLNDYIKEENKPEEPKQEGIQPESEEPKKKKKRKFGLSNVLIILYLLAHLAYTAWMFTTDWVHALLWLFISLVELAVFSVVLKTQKKVYLLGKIWI